MKKLISLFVVLVLFTVSTTSTLYARPAKPGLTTVSQKDGTSILVFLKGDERIKWAESEDGYTLLRNESDIFEYAVWDSASNLRPSGVKAHSIKERSQVEKTFLQNCVKELPFSINQIKEAIEVGPKVVRASSFSVFESTVNNTTTALTTKGKQFVKKSENSNKIPKDSLIVYHKVPIILVNFANRKCMFTASDFEDLINTRNYTENGATGSVIDYFSDCTGGLLDFTGDIMGPYELQMDMSYYGKNDMTGMDQKPREMVKEALNAALEDNKDFSKYDRDNDGLVDGVHIIFAGQGEEVTGESDAIWSHEWKLRSPHQVGSKAVSVYSCSPEQGSNKEELTTIGVIVHEMSHALGLPDLYDTDYDASGTARDPGNFDVMANGSYNNGGKTPPLHNGWSRVKLGFAQGERVEQPYRVRLEPSMESNKVFFVQSPTESEYFVLDNRLSSKWDSHIPGFGMLIFAVNESVPGWNSNCINCDEQNRGFYIKQANGDENSNALFDEGTPYGSSTANTEFTDNSIPSSKTSSGQPTNKPITDIAVDGKDITFVYMNGYNAPWWVNQYNVSNENMSFEGNYMLYCSPNPAKDKVSIICSEPIKTLRLLDLHGRCLKTARELGTNYEFSISSQAPGIYIVESLTSNGYKRIKIIKR